MTAAPPSTLVEALRRVIQVLNAGKYRAPEAVVTAEAEQLVDAAYLRTGQGRLKRMDLYARGAEKLPAPVWPVLERMSSQRAAGRPLQYITGIQAFLGHEYEINDEALVPRPETEVLVTRAIEALAAKEPTFGLEIGLGSGIISIELLDRFKRLTMMASEVAPGAIELAERNAKAVLGKDRARLRPLLNSDPRKVCEPFIAVLGSRKADFLISNPPYLAHASEVEERVRKHEPKLALFAPAGDPLHFYKGIARDARKVLNPGAPVFLEVPHERASGIRAAFTSERWDATISEDLTGRERVLVAHPRD